MKRIKTVEELKKVQLEILLSINEYCRDNGIRYSLACGSLLGAIRHKGFIPWDDDIDIQLLRPDYEQLIKVFPERYKDISLISMERDGKWNRAYARAYDLRTIEIEDAKGMIPGIGVGIDIFPIDEAPENDKEWITYNKKRLLLQDLQGIKFLKWRKDRIIAKKIIMVFGQMFLLPFSIRFFAKKIDEMAKKYNGTHSRLLFENCQGIGKRRKRFLRSDFDEFVDIEFEGYKLMAISGYDDYLKQSYGNYMELPPEKDRVCHHVLMAYWKD